MININPNNSPNFKSKIKLVDNRTFISKMKVLKQSECRVPYPWTIETMKTGKRLFTTGIIDCIAGIFTDGKKSAMVHLATRDKTEALDTGVNPFDIDNIEKVLLSKFDIRKKNVHGFILGAWDRNLEYLDQFKKLIKKYEVPHSTLASRKNVHYYGEYSLLFDTPEDTLYLTNNLTDIKSFDESGLLTQHELDILEDGIEFNIYRKNNNKTGSGYDKIRVKAGAKEFFESQFNEVALCELDKWA